MIFKCFLKSFLKFSIDISLSKTFLKVLFLNYIYANLNVFLGYFVIYILGLHHKKGILKPLLMGDL